MHSFEVHSNESVCRKSGRLGLEQVFSPKWVNSGDRVYTALERERLVVARKEMNYPWNMGNNSCPV